LVFVVWIDLDWADSAQSGLRLTQLELTREWTNLIWHGLNKMLQSNIDLNQLGQIWPDLSWFHLNTTQHGLDSS